MADEPQTMRDYAREHPVTTSYQPQTLAAVAERVRAGEHLLFAVREFLDDYHWADTREEKAALITPRPLDLDPRGDALLGALGEHLAAVDDLERPAWSVEPGRFLGSWWFPAEEAAFAPLAIVESPAAFRRRGIFIPDSLLSRV